MDINNSGRLYQIFIKIFITLFVIIIIMPFIVDQAMRFYNDGIIPKDNSIIVFKDMVSGKAVIIKFLDALNKIRNFM